MRRNARRVLDEYLVADARLGAKAARERLVRRWQPRFLGHAYRLTGERELARDIVQEAWLDIFRGLSRLDDAAAFPAWGFRIVTRRAADAIRSAQRRRRHNDAARHEAAVNGVENMPETDGALMIGPISHALAALPKEQRAAIALHYLEEMSIADVAKAMGVPPGTVKTRLLHGRRKLKAALEGESNDNA